MDIPKLHFEKVFIDWLDGALSEELSDDIQAYSFNLFELANNKNFKFGIELIGADCFDINDPDWACEEIWEPSIRFQNIPLEYSGNSWDICLNSIKNLLDGIIQSNSASAIKLKQSKAIAIGFVDGDLHVLWAYDG